MDGSQIVKKKSQDSSSSRSESPSVKSTSPKRFKLNLGSINLKKFLLLALFFLVLGVLVAFTYSWFTVKPEKLMITNITSNSATVSWVTKDKSPGVAIYREKKFSLPVMISTTGSNIAYDDRDVKTAELSLAEENRRKVYENDQGEISFTDINTEVKVIGKEKYYVHHVTLLGLESKKSYYFMVGDGFFFKKIKSAQFGSDSFTTFEEPDSIDVPNPTYGRIFDSNDHSKGSGDAVVYIQLDYGDGLISQFYSAVTSSNGTWYLDQSNIYNIDGVALDRVHDGMVQDVYVEAGAGGAVGVFENSTSQDAPMRDLVLSEDISTSVYTLWSSLRGNNLVSEAYAADNLPDCSYWSCTNQMVNGQLQPGFCITNYCNITSTNPCKVDTCGGVDEKSSFLPSEPAPGSDMSVSASQENTGIENDCTGKDCGLGKCITGPNPNDGGWGCDCTADPDIPPSTSPKMCGSIGTPVDDTGAIAIGNCNTVPDSMRCKDDGGLLECGFDACGNLCTNVCNPSTQYCSTTGSCTNYPSPESQVIESAIEDNPLQPEIDGTRAIALSPALLPVDTSSDSEGFSDEELLPDGALWSQKGYGNDSTCGGRTSSDPACGSCNLLSYSNQNTFQTAFYYYVCVPKNDLRIFELTYKTSGDCETACGDFGSCNATGEMTCFVGEAGCDPNSLSNAEIGTACDTPGSYGCDENGALSYVYQTYRCVRDGSDVMGESTVNLITEVSADEATPLKSNTVIFDPSAGVYYIPNEGVYTVTFKGKEYEAIVDDISTPVKLFIDVNGSLVYDEGDIILTQDPTELNLVRSESLLKYDLKKGYNFIAVPLVMPKFNTASQFLLELNSQSDGNVLSIAKYDSRWQIVGSNGDNYDANDFQIVPGTGYIVKASANTTVEIRGQEIKFDSVGDFAPIYFNSGWNLVGIYGSNAKEYTAESFIDAINSYTEIDLTADNVTRWPTEKARYEGLQKTINDDGTSDVYGFDFPLDNTQKTAYFVRVISGQGKWEPGL
ncbi:fibronectin type III domain-containing protein [Candidatus Nomurabacteria bacterium]|nr:fibronectin type III domain-containing protein [Candidatus Nomurabacteria bacterium]